jgi:rubrerythrin
MSNSIVLYETFHGSAKKVAEIIAECLHCKCINVNTPFEAEDLSGIDNVIPVFNFRRPYTAQLTKLYLGRVKAQLKKKNLILVGEGLFSEKEFPIVAEEIYNLAPSKNFERFFVTGQLRVETLFPEEQALLKKFSELTGMVIRDMGELDVNRAQEVAQEIARLVETEAFCAAAQAEPQAEESGEEWVCAVCGYTHRGATPPEKCPLCGVPQERFNKK